MSLVRGEASRDLVNSDPSRALHLRSIQVNYKYVRRNRPVTVEIKISGGRSHSSRKYEQIEAAKWNINIQLALASHLIIVIREHRQLHPDKKYEFPITVTDELIMKPVLVIDEPDNRKISLTIHFEAAGPFIDLVRCLVEESQRRLENMKVFLDRLGKACEVLDYVINISERATDIHPAVNAAVSTVTQLYEACKKQRECHRAASELILEIAEFLPFVEVPKNRLKADITTETTRRMLELFEEICRMIIQYSDATTLGILLNDRVEEVNSRKGDLRRLKETYDWCVKTETWKTVLQIESHVESATLMRLRPVPNAMYKVDKSCFEGSRRGTLRMIEDWSTSDSKLFWIYGPPGSGKTAIAHSVAQLFDKQNRLAGCFFCNKEDSERQGEQRILPTIAYQFAKWHAAYRSIVLNVLQGCSELDLDKGLARQFDLLVQKALVGLEVHRPPKHKPLVIVIDALEECDISSSSRYRLARYVSDISRVAPWIKIFISSAKLPELEACLLIDSSQRLDIGDPFLDLQNDIAAYAKWNTYNYLGSTRSHDVEEQASGLLLRISRVLQGPDEEKQKTSTPDHFKPRQETASQFFWMAINYIRRILLNDKKSVKTHLDVLVVASCIAPEQLLNIELLLHFLNIFYPGVTLDALRETIKLLYLFISWDNDGYICGSLPTKTFVDAMSTQTQLERLWVNPRLVHIKLAKKCLDTLRVELKFNICGLPSSYLRNENIPDFSSRVKSNVSDVLQYSSLHWMGHILQACDVQEFRGLVTELLHSLKAVFWIEVLSLLGCLEKGKEILLQCIVHFKDSDKIVCAANELHSFICTFYNVITVSTPHVYVSALTLFPSSSIMSWRLSTVLMGRKLTASEPLLPNYTDNSTFQKPSVPFLEGNTQGICSAYFTPDRRRIISYTHRNMFQIWDTYTRQAISEPFENRVPAIRAIAYSPDGSRITSGCDDGKLRVWDAHTGALLIESQEGHSDWIGTLAYSPDGNRIVTGSRDTTLRIWDAQSGACFGEPLTGHNDWVNAVAYAPDKHRIVSGSDDGTLRIWDAQSGARVGKPLRGHGDGIWAVAYAPDGSRIVSGSGGRTLRIWDVQSHASISELNGHSNGVLSVAYSPDGTRIVSGSEDQTLRVWDARTGRNIGKPLKGHSSYVMSVAYSPDSSRIVSASHDKTLRIWDTHSGKSIGLSGHESRIVSVAYSPDGNNIASGSLNGTIRIWDARSGACIKFIVLGESRWDPDAQCFLTIATHDMFPEPVLTVAHTTNPSTIPDDGWLRTLDGSPFSWVPPEHRRSICHTGQVHVPNDKDGKVMYIDWTKIPHGRDWTNIKCAERLDTE